MTTKVSSLWQRLRWLGLPAGRAKCPVQEFKARLGGGIHRCYLN